MKLSTKDRDDLFKYTRYFVLKAFQIILESRSGHKDSTPCRKKSDWFNLNIIDDPPGLLVKIKKNVTNKINLGCPVCVEVLLVTPEGDKMVLETWCICLLPEQSDPSPKITHTVYNQMGILLKSLISVTRVIPAYKYSQRQGPETYKMYYEIYENDPEVHALGEGCKQIRIGQICTPVGTLQLSVAYRIKMTFTPTQSSSRENSMMLKSDHFNANLYPQFGQHQGDDKQRRKIAAFADPKPPRIKQQVPAFKPGGMVLNPKLYYSIVEGREPTPSGEETEDEVKKNPKTEEICPLDSSIEKDKSERIETISENPEQLSSSEKSSSNENMSIIPKYSSRHSFRRIGKAMHFPFATPTPKNELVNFYRECAHAPPLVSLSETTTPLKDVLEQFAAFEMKSKEYDEMVKSLCESADDSDN